MKAITLIENDITVSEYLMLRDKVHWRRLSNHQAEAALKNCLYNLKAVDADGNILGMGRVVGDGAVICYIQDLIVVPEAQKQGIGSALISRLKDYVISIQEPGTPMMLCLMCAKGREHFYEEHGFVARPNETLGPGMMQLL